MRRHLGHIERQPGLRLRADLRRQLGARVERGSAPGAAPLGVESVRIDATYLRGSAAVAAAPAGSAGASLLKAAERDARALAKEPRPYARAFSRALSAAVALERGRLDRAAILYAEAAAGFDALEMSLHAAVMRWRQGEILLGEEGGALLDGADRWLREQGVVRPDRMVAMLAPLRG